MSVFTALAVATAAVGAVMAYLTRDITFFGEDTDNRRYTRAAAAMRWYQWPSSLNRLTQGKAPMKLFFVVLLAAVQRALPRHARESERPVVLLCILSNCTSVLLLFFVARPYWGVAPAAFLAALLLVSLWPWQVAIFGGPVCLAQACLLASIVLTQIAVNTGGPAAVAAFVAAGATAGLTQFSSSSARKYLPLLAIVFFEGEWRLGAAGHRATVAWAAAVVGIVAVAAGVVLMLVRRRVPPMVKAAYAGRGVRWLVAAMSGPRRKQWGHYERRTNDMLGVFTKWTAIAAAYAAACLVVFPSPAFVAHHAALVAGFGLAALWLTLPDVVPNLRLYLYFVNAQKLQGSRFELYRAAFARRGLTIPPAMRGAGVPWLVRFFPRIAPVESALYGLAVLIITADVARGGFDARDAGRALLVVAASLAPIVVAERSGAPQIARTYFPCLLGLFVAIGEAAWRLGRVADGGLLVTAAVLVAGTAAVVNGRVFFTDVWPARMAPARLSAALAALPAGPLQTYDIAYNDNFVRSMSDDARRRLEMRVIRGLDEVEDGWVVVPGTSAKAVTMESYAAGIEGADFTADAMLNHLLDSREIERFAVASFATMGSSRIWVHEAEITSYRDLILREITDADRWRGRGWILDGGRLRAERHGSSPQWTTTVS